MKFIKKRVICTHCAILGPHKTHTVLLLTELKDKNNKRIKQISDEKRKIELYKELLETENFSDILKKKIDDVYNLKNSFTKSELINILIQICESLNYRRLSYQVAKISGLENRFCDYCISRLFHTQINIIH